METQGSDPDPESRRVPGLWGDFGGGVSGEKTRREGEPDDSTEENLRLLATYLERHGRPLSFYTDKAALFTTTLKTKRGELAGKDRAELPPTQLGRVLKELDIEWIAAHSPQAKDVWTADLAQPRIAW